MKVKELVAAGNTVNFTRYFDGQLWYEVLDVKGDPVGFEFPVPTSDIGNATFLAKDKALLFMRYIRKHVQMLEEAQKNNGVEPLCGCADNSADCVNCWGF